MISSSGARTSRTAPSSLLELKALLRARRRLILWSLLFVVAAAAYPTWTGSGPSHETAGVLLIVAYVVVPVLMVSGVVSEDLRSGAALVWLQKPVRPVTLYLGRALWAALAGLLLVALLTGVAAVLVASGGRQGAALLKLLPLGALTVLSTASVTFALSAMGTRLDASVALAYVLITSLFGSLGELLPENLSAVARVVGFPVADLIELEGWLRAPGQAPPVGPGLHVMAFILAWTALAVLALRYSTRRPFEYRS